MSELKLPDNVTEKVVEKITEGISNIFKKTIIFDKTERMKGIFIGIFISTSIFGLFTIYNTYNILSIKDKLDKLDK